MSKDKDTQLIWENYSQATDNEADPLEAPVHEEQDRGDEAGDYIAFLRTMARELVNNDMPEETAMENVLSHPFEETYGEYLRTRGVTGVYAAAAKHVQLADKMNAYHEVDMNDLDNWKYS
jgi:hypothetical protein